MLLRPYQKDALAATFQYWNQGGDNPLVVMATGTGKSLVQASMAQTLIADYSGLRVVSITHVQELIEQNYKELLNIWPWAPAGMYSAGLGARDISRQIVFGGIQSLFRRVAELGWVDLLMVDEAQLVPRTADTMYGAFISALLAINPDMRVVGFTATPFRTDSGRLDEGEARLFDRIVFDYGIGDGIRDGYLTRLVSKGVDTHFDLNGVGTRGGDYIAGALQDACDKEETTRQAVEEIVAYGRNRHTWLAFCAGVQHAFHVRDEIRRHGVTCETITGDTPKGERKKILEMYRAGEIRALTNNTVLTVGTNVKGIDLIAGLRPTKSEGLYVQMAGRGTRPLYADGYDLEDQRMRLEAIASGLKPNCLYLDFAKNVHEHGPVDDIQPRTPGKGDGEAPVKECPNCRSLVPISARKCPECGSPFELKDAPKHSVTAAVTPILKEDANKPLTYLVQSRTFARHVNNAGDESVRVEFMAGFAVYKMWLSIAKAPGRANKFWKDHGGRGPSPADVDEWLERQGELRPSLAFVTRKNGKYTEILLVKPQPAEYVAPIAAANDNNSESLDDAIPF